ncbi:single-stranded DNA-binding protein [Mycoplasma capricolum subsp. capripneumoniae]|uniref:Single-stranded DNA-binding protein n=1 Tax=Mycoplasma capricolum subsp. capripneumoniae 87001 TaxID=1124992 RepID=A0A9N7ASG4_MYCCC|nr:single-stranded DNA-binding protein [Mycoplasma capricolum]AJK51303.1 single-stranded DNA-binding protein [Mycoplasma capricolum subsp. capripneumoniae 87001]AOQ22008.1 single-stranded DNA-binding protein [Mycoplasma capricolum subsp. capripneumoniae M1601]AQU77412.1 single-stranded DNA-binding protein [Mycoplasma capricolum subsp. capripneumoniae]KEY84236.1 Single-strand binding protein [Mycoplasma capricolum subsp. capripneumoniae 99108]QDL19490.1 single-stranded DNA-binding protein [Myco
MNQINIVGRIVNNLELKSSKNKNPFVFFTVAVNEFWNSERQTTYIPCVVFNDKAVNLVQYINKGDLVSIVAKLNIRRIVEDNGDFKNIFNVVVSKIELLSRAARSSYKDNQEQSDLDVSSNKNSSLGNEIFSDEQKEIFGDEIPDSVIWD